ncbi:MAG: undecaprenyl-phosphate glucose phosphotransferase [Gammaproteobacteria bacterium]|nr:undecaprenyl-phosphate glucose phosphotransferase [Gammaproteobacteria bacterium]
MSIDAQGLIKPHSSKFSLLARCLDATMVILGLSLVTPLHLGEFNTGSVASAFVAALFLQLLGEFVEIYRSWRSESVWAEARQVLFCWFTSFSLLLLLQGALRMDQGILLWPAYLQWFALTLLMLLGWRFIARNLLYRLRALGFNTRRVAVVGSSEIAQETARRLLDCTWGGYRFAGFYDDRQLAERAATDERRLRYQKGVVEQYAGNLKQLVQDARSGRLDSIFLAMPMNAELRIQAITRELTNSTASVYLIPDLFTFELLHARSINLNGIPAISIVGEPNRGVQSLLKRLVDLIGASLILTIIALPMLAIAFAIKFTSRGPVFFRQTRYGLDGKPFKVWKFRTMSVCEDNDADIRQAQKNDSRLTPIGGFLRRTSMDELPQFFNVLFGNMSIVGPRPHAVAHNELYRSKINSYMLRHKIKPGITGWAQVNGWRGETDTLEKMQKRIDFDLYYIRHWSIAMDIKIVFMTIFKGFSGANAY